MDKANRTLACSEYVGFDSLPHQKVTGVITKGFCFNILCVGETGIGKSTVMDSLFDTSFKSCPSTHFEPAVKLSAKTYELQEARVRLKLTVVKTVGFGDQLNRGDSHRDVLRYINGQYEAYFQEELKVVRSLHNFPDSRVHVCIYFIAPTGHSLKSLDLVTLKRLHKKVNVIPVIGKADSMSKADLLKFKQKVMAELLGNGIHIYQFPEDDVVFSKTNAAVNRILPFAIVGGTEEVLVGDKMVKGRRYPWGMVQVDNEMHCDFVKLREMLISTNMDDLRETTHLCHYETYRRGRLQEMGFVDTETEGTSPSTQEELDSKRQEMLEELRQNEEEMRLSFLQRVKEKDVELRQTERELQERFEQMRKTQLKEKNKLDEQKKTLMENIDVFCTEKANFLSLYNESQNNNEANWNNNMGNSGNRTDCKDGDNYVITSQSSVIRNSRDRRTASNGCCRNS